MLGNPSSMMLFYDRQVSATSTNGVTNSNTIRATRPSVFGRRPMVISAGSAFDNPLHVQVSSSRLPDCRQLQQQSSDQADISRAPAEHYCCIHRAGTTELAEVGLEEIYSPNSGHPDFALHNLRRSHTTLHLESIHIDGSVLEKGDGTPNTIDLSFPSRSLTTHCAPRTGTMAPAVSMPGTPPELTDSQPSHSSPPGSSRSPSPKTSRLNTMNFEDITLHEDEKSSPSLSTQQSSKHYRKENRFTSEYDQSKRPVLATLQTQPGRYSRAAQNGVRSAATPTTKRSFTTTVIPPEFSKASRTDSTLLTRVHSATQPRSTSFNFSQNSSLNVPLRKDSWQPARKTAKQLEAEYHDSDDDLPDNASLFNVPLSPFPTHGWSTRSSARGSPNRSPQSRSVSPGPIPLAHARTTPESPPFQRTTSQVMPKRRATHRTYTNTPIPSLPLASANLPRDGRVKSWNIVMADLDDEARIIAEKLEYHADTDIKSLHRCSAPSIIPLPPIQRGTLDFMPASKEKQACLSRTRPSWLPPKNPKEEAKHLKQYKQMMQAALEVERKREEKVQRQLRRSSDSTRDSLHKIWTFYIDPTTDLNMIDSRVNDLCWRGIPPQLRGRVWRRALGDHTDVTSTDYTSALEKVKNLKLKPREEMEDAENDLVDRYADIERDAETAFPELKLFERNGPLWQDLIDVCQAYITHNSEHQYFFGVLLLSAILLLQFSDSSAAFVTLAHCLKKLTAISFHNGDGETLQRTYEKTQSVVRSKFPRLHDYLFTSEEHNGLGFSTEDVFEPMFFSLFSNGMDAEQLCRVWDIWFFKGDEIWSHTAAAVLGALQSQIFGIQGDINNRRDKIREMLGWGPYNRLNSGYWDLAVVSETDAFIGAVQSAGQPN